MSFGASLVLQFGQASQTIYWDVKQGRASGTPTVSVWDDNEGDDATAESATTGSASVETNPNTTTDASCGPDSVQTNMTKIPVTATTGFTIGRQYLITDATTGRSEWFECTGVVSGDYVLSRNPLSHLYASGSAVVGTRISITIDTTWISSTDNLSDPLDLYPRWRAACDYTVGGVAYHQAIYFDVARYVSTFGTFGVNGVDCDRESPGWLDRLPTDYRVGQGEQVIIEAARQVKADLSHINRRDWAQRHSEQFHRLIAMQAEVRCQEAAFQHGGQNLPQLERAKQKYDEHFTKWMAAARAPEQVTTNGAGGQPDRRLAWRR